MRFVLQLYFCEINKKVIEFVGIVEVLEEDTVRLMQDQMALLFSKAKSTINEHILNVYAENELDERDRRREIGNPDFSTKPANYHNSRVVISAGYSVKSLQWIRFRIWATAAFGKERLLHLCQYFNILNF